MTPKTCDICGPSEFDPMRPRSPGYYEGWNCRQCGLAVYWNDDARQYESDSREAYEIGLRRGKGQ